MPKASKTPPAKPATPAKSKNGNGKHKPASLMQQYRQAKEQHPDMILLFKGDNDYNVFMEDAIVVAGVINVPLKEKADMKITKFPHKDLEENLKSLLAAGHRVVLCEQVDEATTGKEVERVVTPLTDEGDALLNLPVIHNRLTVVEYSTASEMGPWTVEHAKEALGWETEPQFHKRMLRGDPQYKPLPWGEAVVNPEKGATHPVHCEDEDGHKVVCWKNMGNRALDDRWREKLEDTILCGRWAGPHTIPGETVNGETIRISHQGRVLSAQHQCTALIRADQKLANSRKLPGNAANPKYPFWNGHEHPFIETLVITGVSEDPRVLQTIDYVKPRSLADVLYTLPFFKEKLPRDRQELTRMTAMGAEMLWDRVGTLGYKTHGEMVEFLDRHKRLLDCMVHLFENNSQAANGGKKITNLRLSPGQCATVCYLMGASGENTDGVAYRNQSPPSEGMKVRGRAVIDWQLWGGAFEFWTKLAGDATFQPVRNALINLRDSSPTNVHNVGLGGKAEEKLAILDGAWRRYKGWSGDGEPFSNEDRAPGGILHLDYSLLDNDSNPLPADEVTLLSVADFGGIDYLERSKKGEPDGPIVTREEIEALMQAKDEERRKANMQKEGKYVR